MNQIVMYSTDWCGYCSGARQLLTTRGIEFTEVDVGSDPSFRQRLVELTGRSTVPQILIDGTPVGGYAELRRLDADGLLEHLRTPQLRS